MARVIMRATDAIARQPRLILGLSLLLVFLPEWLIQQLFAAQLGRVENPRGFSPSPFGGLIGVFGGYVAAAAIGYAIVTEADGGRPRLIAALYAGVRSALRLFLLTLLVLVGLGLGVAGIVTAFFSDGSDSLILGFGLIFLIVPASYAGLMWSVAIPAMVAERLGALPSLARSRRLTKGWRGTIFLLLIVFSVLFGVAEFVAGLLTGAFAEDTSGLASRLPGLVAGLLRTLLYTMLNALLAAIYLELRTIKEGASHESLANIFA